MGKGLGKEEQSKKKASKNSERLLEQLDEASFCPVARSAFLLFDDGKVVAKSQSALGLQKWVHRQQRGQ